jgi:hypothetical protein
MEDFIYFLIIKIFIDIIKMTTTTKMEVERKIKTWEHDYYYLYLVEKK